MERESLAGTSLRLDMEIRRFAENLSFESFRALSSGIGLGSMHRPSHASTEPPAPNMSFSLASLGGVEPENIAGKPATILPSPVYKAENKGMANNKPNHAAAIASQSRGQPASIKRPRLSFAQLLVAWSIDLLFVAASVGTALALAVVLGVARSGQGISAGLQDWLSLPPVLWLAKFNPLQILAGVYGLFVVYYILFRWLVGHTLGENLLRSTKRAKSLVRSLP